MPKKYYCEYCDVFLKNSSKSTRQDHNKGKKHLQNKMMYYKKVIIEQCMQNGINNPMYAMMNFQMLQQQQQAPQQITQNSQGVPQHSIPMMMPPYQNLPPQFQVPGIPMMPHSNMQTQIEHSESKGQNGNMYHDKNN